MTNVATDAGLQVALEDVADQRDAQRRLWKVM
jgi:hypothetical protein